MNNQNQTQKNRFHWIDRTKGLAILGIILFHFFQNYPEHNSLITILDRNGARIGYAAVDIFFLMAGFNTSYTIVAKSIKAGSDQIQVRWKSWLGKRLFRLYPSYLLAVILTCLLYYFAGKLQKIELTPNFILSVIGLAGIKLQAINPGFWFFTVILEAYLFTPLIFIICKNQPQEILWVGIIIATLTKIFSFYFLLDGNTGTYLFLLQNNFLGSYIFQFCLGLYWGFIYAEYQSFRKIDFLVSTIIFAVGLSLYGLFIICDIKIIYMLGFDMLFIPFFFLGIKLILLKLEKIASFQRILSFLSILGIYSYQIYLIHQPLYFSILYPLNKSIHLNSYLKIITILSIVMILLTIYVFVFTIIEKNVMKLIENNGKQKE